MKEIEALNFLLRQIGSSPVSDLETDHPDAVNAKGTLKRLRRRVQKRDWWFNTDYNVQFPVDHKNEIRIPSEIVSIQMEGNNTLTIRDGKLYDTVNNTYQFNGTQTAYKVIRALDWDSMPESMQEHCMYYAASEFVRDELEDGNKEQSLQRSAGQAFMEVSNQDLRESGRNMFNSPQAIKFKSGVRPYRRGTVRFYGDPDA